MFSDVARRLARRFLYPALEQSWGLLFALAGRALRAHARVPVWTAQGGQRVLIVAPHPDDETIGTGGVAMLHLRAGDEVTVVVVTDGGASRAGGLTEAEIVRRRASEVRAAAGILGVRDLVGLGLSEGHWEDDELRDRLAPLLADAEIVYAPSCVDFHPDHLRVARIVAELLRAGQLVRVYELGVPLTPCLVNRVALIDSVATQKDRALAAFHTQAMSIAAVQRLARHQARFYGSRAVEVFWELTPQAYTRVISAGDWWSSDSPYRGIRPRPLADPLAALVGLRTRTALRRVADQQLHTAEQPFERATIGGQRG